MFNSLKFWRKKSRSTWSMKFYLRIYLALLASLVVSAIFVGIFVQVVMSNPENIKRDSNYFSQIASDALAPAGASKEQQRKAVERWGFWMDAHLTLYETDGSLITSTRADAPVRVPPNIKNGWFTGLPRTIGVQLPDERWLVYEHRRGTYFPTQGQSLMAILVALAVALGSYPIVRRLTKRLERLQSSVDALGEGQLSTRVLVEGNDEVAQLATSFNQSAARIEALVAAQKSLLANASHELRSPLTRIRMAIEIMQEQAQPAIREELSRNISELDQLIDEILLSSRLEATVDSIENSEDVDLTGLLAEECARVNAELTLEVEDILASSVSVRGEAKLLRRLFRNLLENARRYGNDHAIDVTLCVTLGQIEINVCDRGVGVPVDQRERIFEPFYRLPGASESNGGVGLGLSLVKQIALRHGAQVQCLARDGGGSCFRVSFPQVSE